jgi:hypothetical protein
MHFAPRRCRVRVKLTVLCFITLVLFINTAPGQSANGTVSGIVLDPSGGVIAGADVLIVNDATAVQYPGKTNSEGYYVVPNIAPGTYRIQVSNSGFKTIVKPDIVIHVEDALAINFTLPIGAASEIVTVEGGAPLINTENASVGTVIDRNFVENLPLNGRSFNTLLQLTPGVVIAPISSSLEHGQFSIAGQRTDANSFSVDGVSANFGAASTAGMGQSGTGTAQAFSALGGTSSLVSVDALQEFKIETSSFAPEFGRSPGGQVTLNTRSGTNEFHGAVFDYFRNTVMDANNWFNDEASPEIPKAPEHHNDFGGVFGGPIWKDRMFFFASYEGARLDVPSTEMITVPYIGSAVPSCSPAPAIAPFLEAYPKPNGPVSSGTCTGQFTGAFANKATLNAGSLRIDHTFNGRFSIFGRYNDAPSQLVNRTYSLSTVETVITNTQTVTVGVNMTLSNRLFNVLRGNYSTQRAGLSYALDSFGGAAPPDPSLLSGSLPLGQTLTSFIPLDGTEDYFVGPDARNRTKQLNFVDDLSFTPGAHQLKFGGDYRAIFLDNVPDKNAVTYFSLGVQNLISTGQVLEFIPQISLPARILSQSTALYAQDNWKVSRRLVLTYGVRWELSPAPQGLGSTTLPSWLNVKNLSAITLAPAGTSLWHTTYGNLAPRFGMAYSMDRAGSMVLRAGAGVFYDLGVGAAADLAAYFPNSVAVRYLFQSIPVANIDSLLPTVSSAPPYPAVGVVGFDPNLKLPRSYQWNVALEKSFGGRQTISATYVGQAGRDLLRQEALYQPNINFLGAFDLTGNDARSNYDAFQLQYRRPLASRVQALLNYTYSHSLDNASNDVIAGLSNTVISAANDYASSDFDVRHSFSGAVTIAVPPVGRSGALSQLTRDWSLDTVVVARTGFPVNPEVSAPSSLGASYIRPDIVPGQPFYLYGAQCAQVFGPISEGGNGALEAGQVCPGGKGLNPAAFDATTPKAENRQGTLGRNAIHGFGMTQVDLSISRKFPVTERLNLQFRADAFNLFNHPNFANPPGNPVSEPYSLLSQVTLNTGLGGLNPIFQQGGPRSLQLSLRLAF